MGNGAQWSMSGAMAGSSLNSGGSKCKCPGAGVCQTQASQLQHYWYVEQIILYCGLSCASTPLSTHQMQGHRL